MDISIYTSVIKEIDERLSEIDKKYNNYAPNHHKNSTEALIAKLLGEFNSLGLTNDNSSSNHAAVLRNALKLINIHRKALVELDDRNGALTKSKLENSELKNKIHALQCELSDRLSTCDALKQKLSLLVLDNDYIAKEKLKLQSDLQSVNKALEYKERVWENRLRQLSCENTHLNDVVSKNIGNYKSRDDVVIEAISKYKKNEEVYKDTILKLQENNRALLGEILNLKQEIVMNFFRTNEN